MKILSSFSSKVVLNRRLFFSYSLACILLIITGCARIQVSPDSSSPFYRKDGVDFSSYDTAVIDFEEITTTNDKGVDIVKSMTHQSLQTWLRQSGMFSSVKDKTETDLTGKVLLLKAKVKVHWGNRAARYLISFGAGKAHIWLNYYVYEKGSTELLAKMEAHDTMSGGAFGGGAKQLVYNASEKWNNFFINNIIKSAR